ncbi:MAG TPA: hypothetical protein VFC17_08370 [Candidatus Limnocylindrales bacterium]|jgi:hypothetical protein|nr:hypothetical protein [Candidatus Limnocylindrales bacterium]
MIVALAVFSAGCSGINAGTSVSPASFFLPGIMKTDPPATNPPVLLVKNSVQLATVR